MKFIIVDNNSGKARSFTANGFLLGLTFLSLIGFPTAAGYLSYRHGMGEAALTNEMVGKWRLVLKDQEQQIEDAKRDAEDNLEASALRLAQLQRVRVAHGAFLPAAPVADHGIARPKRSAQLLVALQRRLDGFPRTKHGVARRPHHLHVVLEGHRGNRICMRFSSQRIRLPRLL